MTPKHLEDYAAITWELGAAIEWRCRVCGDITDDPDIAGR